MTHLFRPKRLDTYQEKVRTESSEIGRPKRPFVPAKYKDQILTNQSSRSLANHELVFEFSKRNKTAI